MNALRKHPASSSRGSALIVGLIMLLLITVFALSTFNLGKSSLEIAGNANNANTVVMAANDVIQEAASTTRLYGSPSSVLLNPCGAANTRCFDSNGGGGNDVTVVLNPIPTCIQSLIISNTALDYGNPLDQICAVGTPQTFGIVGSANNNSLCSNSIWNLSAVATDNVTRSTATVNEGVTVRVATAIVSTFCP